MKARGRRFDPGWLHSVRESPTVTYGGGRFILAHNVGTADDGDRADEPDRLIMVTNFFEELKRLVPN